MEEVSTCDKDHMAHRAEIIYYLALHRKSLLSHVLGDLPFNIIYMHQSIEILLYSKLKKIESPGHLLQPEVSKLKNNIEKSSTYKHLVPKMAKSRAEGNNSA